MAHVVVESATAQGPGPPGAPLASLDHATAPATAPATLRRLGPDQWRAIVPATFLVLVAVMQVVVTRDGALVPWKGGGFGMFSATDGASFRRTRIVVERDGRSETVDVPASLEAVELRARLFPSDRLLRALAAGVIEREQRHATPVDGVTAEVWRTRFAPDRLTPVEESVRSLVHRAR